MFPVMRCCLIFCLVLLLTSSVLAQPLSKTETLDVGSGSLLEFVEGDYILANGLEMPEHGWQKTTHPKIYSMDRLDTRVGDYRTVAGRFYFEREAIGDDPLALYTVGMRNNFTVYLNGREVFRNFADNSDENNSWYHPWLIPLPDTLLEAGANEILIHTFSRKTVGIGRLLIGPNMTVKSYYNSKFFWHITAPMTANFAMLLIGLLVLLFWLGRRHEVELLWLTISTGLWFLRNHEYFSLAVPFNMELYTSLTVYATYFGAASSAAFYFCFIKLPHRHRIIAFMMLAGIPLVAADLLIAASDLWIYLPTIIIVFALAICGLVDLMRHRNIERGVLGFWMMMMPFSSLYDLHMAMVHAGDGHATYIAVFGGLIYTAAFLISFGKRALDAFTDIGASNVMLARRISETRAELAESEALRQELVVEKAITAERARLMQEMHDGIGSNLITALAVARQQNHPKETISTLRRALGDLKITVDSLEPVEGDLVALIGNLRHRMTGDLLDAGISCKWDVEECRPLQWLDATNALHVLRIYSEAIGNVLAHSGATEITISCAENEHEGVPGISTYIADNGRGFDVSQMTQGKGLANIRARARSLHGRLSYESQSGTGTIIRLWLPFERITAITRPASPQPPARE